MCQLFKRSHCLTKWTFWLKIYFCKQRWGGRKLIVERHLFDLIKSIRRIPKVHCLHKTTLWVRHGINNKPHIYWFIHFIHSFVLTLKSPIGEVVNLAYMYTYIHTTQREREKCIVGELCRTEKKLSFSISLMSNSNRRSCGVYKLLCWKNRREMTNRKKMRNFLTIW